MRLTPGEVNCQKIQLRHTFNNLIRGTSKSEPIVVARVSQENTARCTDCFQDGQTFIDKVFPNTLALVFKKHWDGTEPVRSLLPSEMVTGENAMWPKTFPLTSATSEIVSECASRKALAINCSVWLLISRVSEALSVTSDIALKSDSLFADNNVHVQSTPHQNLVANS